MLAAAVMLTNFAQAEVTGKALPPNNGVCPNITGLGVPLGIPEFGSAAPRPVLVCLETLDEYNAYSGVRLGQSLTLTTTSNFYVIETRDVGGRGATEVARVIARTPPSPDPMPDPAPDPMTPPDDGNTQMPPNMDDGNTQMPDDMPDNTPTNPQTPAATVQAKSSNDAKRLAQYGAAGFAAIVLINNYWLGAPLGVLPFNMAVNEKGAIFSGTSFRLSPQETIHLSALESVDDKRGEYKFGVQWHYQFAPPGGLTETPQAALPAVYTMPNVTPKDWLKK